MKVTLQRAYKFRIYPTPAQEAELSEHERQLRRLYNLAHEQRLAALARPLRPKEWGGCRGCGVPKDPEGKYVHAPNCTIVDYYRQNREQTALLEDDKLQRVVWSARQEVLRDLEKAWQRWRKGLGGKPRFKRRTDRCRIYLASPAQWAVSAGGGAKHAGKSKWSLLSFTGMAASVGAIRLRQDRPWPKDAKFTSCSITRDVGEWYAVFPLSFEVEAERPKGGAVGINRGAVHALADSRGRVVDSPRYYARSLLILQRRSRQLDRKLTFGKKAGAPAVKYRGLDPERVNDLAVEHNTTPGKVVYEAKKRGSLEAAVPFLKPSRAEVPVPSEGRNRERARVRLALAHQTIRRRREWFLHNESAYYARTYAKVAFERWRTKDMTSSEAQEKDDGSRELLRVTRARNRSILDVGWYELGRQLTYKVEANGGEVVEVDPGLQATAASETVAGLAAARAKDDDEEAPALDGEAGVSSYCSTCGAPLEEPASGREDAICPACLNVEVGDVNAAKNILKRALFSSEETKESSVKKKVTIGINGKKRKTTVAA